MRKDFLLILLLIMVLFSVCLKAEDKASNPKWFNGNWYGLCIGCPSNSKDSQSLADEKSKGRTAFSEITEQKQKYSEAKESGNYDGVMDNAFWTSSQAWFNNNRGFDAFKRGEYATAKGFLEDAIKLASNAPKLDDDLTVEPSLASAMGAEWVQKSEKDYAAAIKKEKHDLRGIIKIATRTLAAAEKAEAKEAQ